ncbi:MAG TPA: tRNA uridine-5-carboxymethylaminomethyl(34) synthesis GTPase MnmE [Candidatus Izemoplasmatales bacterium]|nr:tRNA uridine-5-carboxymethylaminomethyl(34) synthesis GTPase MnmE [Bacillota bacterium]HRY77874.1 tRNA uridine-5-carboxymethylaminomethyl(34) synthesis GTPase MnmE [Candidatus Izemoplasmatales bacterium]
MVYDTIVGIATLQGMSALNIIRVSGSEAISVVNAVFKGKNLNDVPSHTIHYGHIVDEVGVIDEVMVSVFREPKSFTGENVAEISTHGGSLIPNKIISLLIEKGCRLAENGEFSQRAFLNGRIDLTQAESIMDMISAKTDAQLRLATKGLQGEIKDLIRRVQDDILDLLSQIEVQIDYPEYDDVVHLTQAVLLPQLNVLQANLDTLLQKSNTGKVIRDGIRTVIVGKPNVGKSSLLNRLLREEKAIVTEVSGTTRDLVEGEWNLGGILLRLIDTAGIHETADLVESIGIGRSKKALEEADLVLLVLDQSQKLTKEDLRLLDWTQNKPRIIIGNKVDLGKNVDLTAEKMIDVSALTNVGIDTLEKEVKRMFVDEKIFADHGVLLSNARHIGKIREARSSLNGAISTCDAGLPVDLVEMDLRQAWEHLGEITGQCGADTLIHSLFSKFCLGK